MNLNKKQQNGLLLVLYICRAGRCTVASAAEQLGISKLFLDQIARKLRQAGVIKAFRGPGGGYEVTGDPTAADVIRALGVVRAPLYSRSTVPEIRALGHIMVAAKTAANTVFSQKMRVLNFVLASSEIEAMDGCEDQVVN